MLFAYSPQKDDELELLEGDYVFVSASDQGQTGEIREGWGGGERETERERERQRQRERERQRQRERERERMFILIILLDLSTHTHLYKTMRFQLLVNFLIKIYRISAPSHFPAPLKRGELGNTSFSTLY